MSWAATLPLGLAVASWLCVLLALLALWRSLTSLLHSRQQPPQHMAHSQRADLLEEKRALLASLKDLAFDRDLGKLDANDFAAVDGELRVRAERVLQQLDEDVAAYRPQAEARIAAYLERHGDAKG